MNHATRYTLHAHQTQERFVVSSGPVMRPVSQPTQLHGRFDFNPAGKQAGFSIHSLSAVSRVLSCPGSDEFLSPTQASKLL